MLAYLNGQLIPASQATVPVYDAGFVQGTTVAEQLRTFGGELFRLDLHLQRLTASLELLGVDPGVSLAELAQIARDLARHNHRLLEPGDDLGLSMFVTPGPYPTMAALAQAEARLGPTVCLHTYPLPFQAWAEKYVRGQSLTVTGIEQVPAACWPPTLKCRSRMHYYLADHRAAQLQPGSRALLLDHQGLVLEASTASVFLYQRQEGFISPPTAKILPGVSLSVVAELAQAFGVPFLHRDFTLDEIWNADEVMLCSTSPCVWPVVELNRRPAGGGQPGPMFRRLLAAWSELVGLDIQRQAEHFARRRGT